MENQGCVCERERGREKDVSLFLFMNVCLRDVCVCVCWELGVDVTCVFLPFIAALRAPVPTLNNSGLQ